MFKIETFGGLPRGYNERDYFKDRGACLERTYETEEEAVAAVEAQYKGPDVDGIAPGWQVIRTWS